MKKEFLDSLEAVMINAVKPIVVPMIKAAKSKVGIDEACRNVIAKVGARIMFGSEIYDKAMKNKPQ